MPATLTGFIKYIPEKDIPNIKSFTSSGTTHATGVCDLYPEEKEKKRISFMGSIYTIQEDRQKRINKIFNETINGVFSAI